MWEEQNGTLHATPRPDQLEEQIVVLRTEASKTMSTPMAQVHAHLQEALKQSRHLQDLVGGVETRPEQVHAIPAKRSVPPTASERAPSTNRQETPVHSDTPTSQQQQTRREQELSVELEQARQQIKILQQVLSRSYIHDIIEYIFFVLIAMPYVQELEQHVEIHPLAGALHSTLSLPSHRLHPTEDNDTLDTVLSAIATDPEGFFKLGAAENLDDLPFPEFMQACTSIVPGFSQTAARSIFTKLDSNKNDKVSLEELTQTTEVARHFYKQSKCESVILAALMRLIAGEQPLKALAQLSEGLLRDALVDKLIKALAKQAKAVRETLASKKECEPREDEKGIGKSKFGTATYGAVADYEKGLEAVGTPHPNILEHMRMETTKSLDSKDIFEAWNSGSNETFPMKEWDFVVEPYKPVSISKDKHPSQWELKHDAYGGKRTPIRLQVFLHALSALQLASGIRFSDYKKAHELPFENPQWLHVAEVNFVKVVLLRLAKSQLGGVALCNAFSKHAALRLKGKSRVQMANIKARKIVEALSKALHEKDGSESTCTYEFIVGKLKVLFTPHFASISCM